MKKKHCITLAFVLAMVGGSPAADSNTNWIKAETEAMRSNRTAAITAGMTTPDERRWLEEEQRRISAARGPTRFRTIGGGTEYSSTIIYKLTPPQQALENLRLRKIAESNRVAQAANDQASAIRWQKSAAANDAKIIAWQRERAEQGEASGQYELGMRYLSGSGVTNDLATARALLKKAAAQGHTKAIAELKRIDAGAGNPAAEKKVEGGGK